MTPAPGFSTMQTHRSASWATGPRFPPRTAVTLDAPPAIPPVLRAARLAPMLRGFFENRRGRSLYHALHGDRSDPAEVWIFCPALLEEATFALRPTVQLAEAFARDGATVFRFDYEGQGESEGDARRLGLADWTDDVVSAIEWVRRRFGPEVRINLLAQRAGALVAAEAALRGPLPVHRLLLLAPVLDGAKHFDECLRAHLTTQLACFNKVNEPRAVLKEQLQRGQFVSVLGHDVGQALASSLSGARLRPLLADFRGETDVIHLARTAGRDVSAALADLHGLPRVHLHAGPPVTFWDQAGRYWELTSDLSALVLQVAGRDAGRHGEGA